MSERKLRNSKDGGAVGAAKKDKAIAEEEKTIDTTSGTAKAVTASTTKARKVKSIDSAGSPSTRSASSTSASASASHGEEEEDCVSSVGMDSVEPEGSLNSTMCGSVDHENENEHRPIILSVGEAEAEAEPEQGEVAKASDDAKLRMSGEQGHKTAKQGRLGIWDELDETEEMNMKILLGVNQAGCLIGEAGIRIQGLTRSTGAAIKLSGEHEYFPGTHLRVCLLSGTAGAIRKAMDEILEICFTEPLTRNHIAVGLHGEEKIYLVVPYQAGSPIIGKQGANICELKRATGASVNLSDERTNAFAHKFHERVMEVIGDLNQIKVVVLAVLACMQRSVRYKTYQNCSTRYSRHASLLPSPLPSSPRTEPFYSHTNNTPGPGMFYPIPRTDIYFPQTPPPTGLPPPSAPVPIMYPRPFVIDVPGSSQGPYIHYQNPSQSTNMGGGHTTATPTRQPQQPIYYYNTEMHGSVQFYLPFEASVPLSDGLNQIMSQSKTNIIWTRADEMQGYSYSINGKYCDCMFAKSLIEQTIASRNATATPLPIPFRFLPLSP